MASHTSLAATSPAQLEPGLKPASTSPNTIILTSGLSGSSVLAGLISQSGYWAGDTTFKKEYDTFENSELIELNSRMLQQAGYTGNYTMEFSQEAIDRVAALSGAIDEEPYRTFLKKCDACRPWIWKDPRLWLTIRLWARFLPLDNCRFILLTRDLTHAWVSLTLRRQIRSLKSSNRYELSVRASLAEFLKSEGLLSLSLTYENLIKKPEETIAELNSFLGTNLTTENLKRVYRGPLYKVPRSSPIDYIKALLIYLKNYSERADIRERKH